MNEKPSTGRHGRWRQSSDDAVFEVPTRAMPHQLHRVALPLISLMLSPSASNTW